MYLSEVNGLLTDGDLAALSHDGPAELLHLRFAPSRGHASQFNTAPRVPFVSLLLTTTTSFN